MWRRSLAQDLAEVVRSTLAGDEIPTPRDRMHTLEDEHRLLSERRRRLHQSIDLLEGLDVVKPDAAARLQKYRSTEREISRRRAALYREISELQLERGAQQLSG